MRESRSERPGQGSEREAYCPHTFPSKLFGRGGQKGARKVTDVSVNFFMPITAVVLFRVPRAKLKSVDAIVAGIALNRCFRATSFPIASVVIWVCGAKFSFC